MPTVSVILPTYNRVAVVGSAIESVLSQTFGDFELIVVDDASTDGTLQSLCQVQDRRLHVIRHTVNKGAGAARNTGVERAGANLIAFQDSDDLWVPTKLEEQLSQLEQLPSVGVVYSRFEKRLGKQAFHVPGPWVRTREGHLHEQLLQGNFIGLPTVLVRKRDFERVGGFDEQLRSLEDWDLFLRLSEVAAFAYIDRDLVLSRHSAGGVNAFSPQALASLRRIMDKYPAFKTDPKAVAHASYLEGTMLLHLGESQRGRRLLAKALLKRPAYPKYAWALFASLWGTRNYARLVDLARKLMGSSLHK